MSPVIVGNIDIAMLSLWAFTLFFIGLVVYLNKESRREGYPLEEEDGGRIWPDDIMDGGRKAFDLPHGLGTTYAPPTTPRDPVDIKAVKAWRGAGSPYVPTGNPLVDGIGPAAYANRAKHPDLDWEGHHRIARLSVLPDFRIDRRDMNLVGATVLGADDRVAGTVTDVWIDRTDRIVRYIDVALPTGRTVTVPFNMATLNRRRNLVLVDAVNANQFADAPGLENPAQITLYEEDRIMGYFGGGYLYANADRLEPLL